MKRKLVKSLFDTKFFSSLLPIRKGGGEESWAKAYTTEYQKTKKRQKELKKGIKNLSIL